MVEVVKADGVLRLPEIGIAFPLAEIYANVALGDPDEDEVA